MAEEVQLRFRHPQGGDIGPHKFPVSLTIQQVKERLLALWPKDGPLASEQPASITDVKLILAGKFVDNAKPLQDYRREMGDPTSETIVTMHVVVRPSAASKPNDKGQPDNKEPPKGCGCVIC